MLSVIRWINPHTGLSEGITLNMGQPPSFKITSKNSAYLLSSKLMLEINAALAKYGINAADSEILFMYKEWLDLSEFNSNLDKIAKIIDEELEAGIAKNKIDENNILKRLEVNLLNNYHSILMDKYGE